MTVAQQAKTANAMREIEHLERINRVYQAELERLQMAMKSLRDEQADVKRKLRKLAGVLVQEVAA